MAARDVIIEGSKWKGGDGGRIVVLKHKWLSHKLLFLGELQPNLLVKDLVDPNNGQWDRERVFDLFTHRTQDGNPATACTDASSRDRLVWKENQPKLFNFKSTYQVALRLKHQARIEHSGVRAGCMEKCLGFQCTPKSVHVQTVFLLEIIYIKGEFKLAHGVRYVASKLNQLPIFCGNVLS